MKYFRARNGSQILTVFHVKNQFYAYLVYYSFSFWSYWWASLLILSRFEFRLRVTLSSDGSLSLISRIRNINGKQFSFSFAYHTYFSVSDIRYVIPFLFFCNWAVLLYLTTFAPMSSLKVSASYFIKAEFCSSSACFVESYFFCDFFSHFSNNFFFHSKAAPL